MSSSSSSSSMTLSCLFIFALVLPLSSATVSSEKFLLPLVGDVVNSVTSTVQSLTDNLCDNAPDPTFCKKILPIGNVTHDIFFYGRHVIEQSLSQSKNFLNKIYEFKAKATKPLPALDDCQLLAELNEEFIATSYSRLNATSATLPLATSDDVETYLSATMTNQQACLDGLEETNAPDDVKVGISTEVVSDTKLFGVSLSLFQQGWAPLKKNDAAWKPPQNLHRLAFSHGEMSLKMSKHLHRMFGSVSGRRFLEAVEGTVKVSNIVAVKKDGTGNFTTINEAIEAAPKDSNGTFGYFLIYVAEGVYEEYVSIPRNKPYLMMIGDGINKTVITGNHSNRGGWTTFKSATLAVISPNFIAVNITFRNTAGPEGHQAVAVRNGADLSTFYKCSFEGYQDTLYAFSLRQFYRECDIYGTVDYIFGNAVVVFQKCNIYSRLPMQGQKNAVTAQGRIYANQNTGISIQNCAIVAAPDLLANPNMTKTYLGRPWKEHSRTVIMNSFIAALVDPTGWEPWSGNFALDTLYYVEYKNTGPGSNTAARVKWPGYQAMVNESVAANFTVSNFIDGDDWLPMTGVPYQGGLL